ncbi:MAG: alternate-type signal peptide domain-containing protein [Schumannella sp.]|nr:alternate-type signal peptide domain-containing protein [Microbacteriaceae bacterium]
MNKFTKASIATGAGIVLLLGGAGTLAYWNDSATTGAGSITSGTLDISSYAGTGAGWFDVSADNSSAPESISTSTFRVVPGDTLRYVEWFTISATGDNLVADLAVNADDVLDGLSDDWSVNDWVDATTTFDLYDATGVTQEAAGISEIDSSDNGKRVRVTFEIDFDNAATNDTQTDVLNLGALEVTLTQQTRP